MAVWLSALVSVNVVCCSTCSPVSTGMGNQARKLPRYINSHPEQLSLAIPPWVGVRPAICHQLHSSPKMQREAWATDDYKKAKYATVLNVKKLPVTCEVYEHLVYARSDNPGYIYDIGTELDWSDRPLYDVPGHAVYLRRPRNALYKMYKTTSTVIHLDMFVLRYL